MLYVDGCGGKETVVEEIHYVMICIHLILSIEIVIVLIYLFNLCHYININEY